MSLRMSGLRTAATQRGSFPATSGCGLRETWRLCTYRPNLGRSSFDAIVGAELLSSAAVADVMGTDGLPDDVAWTQLADRWGTTKERSPAFPRDRVELDCHVSG